MTSDKTCLTQTGRVLTDQDVESIANEVETTDHDIEELRARLRGRPLMGAEPMEVLTLREVDR